MSKRDGPERSDNEPQQHNTKADRPGLRGNLGNDDRRNGDYDHTDDDVCVVFEAKPEAGAGPAAPEKLFTCSKVGLDTANTGCVMPPL